MTTGPASIVKLRSSSGIETVKWLCDEHLSQHEAAGLTILEVKPPGHPLGCDPCGQVGQADGDEALFE